MKQPRSRSSQGAILEAAIQLPFIPAARWSIRNAPVKVSLTADSNSISAVRSVRTDLYKDASSMPAFIVAYTTVKCVTPEVAVVVGVVLAVVDADVVAVVDPLALADVVAVVVAVLVPEYEAVGEAVVVAVDEGVVVAVDQGVVVAVEVNVVVPEFDADDVAVDVWVVNRMHCEKEWLSRSM